MPRANGPVHGLYPEPASAGTAPVPLALVNMPLFAVDRPALGISLLKADLERHGIPCANLYLNIPFAERIGLEACGELDLLPRDAAAGDWMFVEALWGRDEERDSGYLRRVAESRVQEDTGEYARKNPMEIEQMLSACRLEATPFIEECLEEVAWRGFRIVGFSCQCQQLTASLALARRLKERYPEIAVVFGGGNCRGDMGTALFKAFPFIDAVCLGEGEGVFAAYAAAVLENRPPGAIPGILHRGTADPAVATAATVADLDGLPYPDFDDFFAQRARFPNAEIRKLHLVVETSRGCWWGQTSQCAFCGLNVNALAYRQKTAPRALEEFASMLDRYGVRTHSLRAADTILPKSFLESFFPLLEASGLKPEIFYYVRSDLSREQVRLARQAGLREIQPGIESLSRAALKRMRKGVTPLQNVRLLKWCRQFGVFPIWYYLYGMPGEQPEEYREGLRILNTISHLTPPARVSRVRIDRYSPFQMRPADFGLRNLRPSPLYRFIYSGLDEGAIRDLAYYFDADFEVDPSIAPLTARLLEDIKRWTKAAESSALFSLDEPERLVVCDFRPGAGTSVHSLTGMRRRAYEACEEIRTRSDLRSMLGAETGGGMAEEALQEVLQPLLDADLLIEEKDQILSLAVPLGFEYFPPEPVWSRFAEIPEAQG